MDDAEQRLDQAAWGYHAALARREGIEARRRQGDRDPSLPDREAEAAEAVVAARNALLALLAVQRASGSMTGSAARTQP